MVVLGPLAGAGYLEIRLQGAESGDTLEFTTLPGAPQAISVLPRDTPVVVGGSYALRAHLVDRHANELPGTPTFGASSPSIQLSASGMVQGVSVGRAKATAQIGQFADSAFTSVVPPGTIAVWDYGRFVGDSAGYTQVDLDGSDARRLFNIGLTPTEYSPGNALGPRWIPGTSQIVYPRNVDGTWRLFVGDSSGVSRRLIGQPGAIAWEIDPEVSPDGVWVYFVGRDSGDVLCRVSVAGGAPEALLRMTGGGQLRTPSLSPGGTEVVYASSSFAGDMFRARVLDLTTGTTRLLTSNEAAGPRWSPNNEWILYAVSGPWGGYSGRLRVVRPDGSDDHQLIDGAYFPGGSWSADGRYAIVIRAEAGTGWELLDVGQGIRLPLSYRFSWYGPAWRP
jgi:Tol biopolymer transport system component